MRKLVSIALVSCVGVLGFLGACKSTDPGAGGGSGGTSGGGTGGAGSGGAKATGGSTGTGGSGGSAGSGSGGTASGGSTGSGGGGSEPPPGDTAPEASPADTAATGDAPSVGDGGAGIVLGARTSLRDLLASKWIGERRTMKQEDGVLVFTGAFNAGTFGGPEGNNVRLDLRSGKEYIFEYRIRFDGAFPFSRGGKIPGLAGGNAPTGCVNVNAQGFSARMMWREGGKLIGYIYDQTQSTDCGNNIATSYTFKSNTWADMKERVRVNTATAGDGILQIWADGNMVINRSNMKYMGTQANNVNVVLFHSFFGGSTQDWAPSRNCTMSFSEPFVTLIEE